MDRQFDLHNTHFKGEKQFIKLDPHLRELSRQKYIYYSPLLDEFPIKIPGIYTLSGGRQIGKTTLLKQWMLQLIKQGIDPKSIYFYTGELILDHFVLLRLLQKQFQTIPSDVLKFIIIDEVSYIEGWDKGIKYAADSGLFENTVIILSGSDTSFLKEARMTFPGRRGKAKRKDFHAYPLSFREFFHITQPPKFFEKCLEQSLNESEMEKLFALFQQYLIHGGFLTAINEFALSKEIQYATLETYSDWVRGDVLKRGKQERYLREILSAIIKRYNSQVTWPSLASDLSIDHPNTVADYCNLLESMDVIFIQYALIEDKLLGAPKKARKIIFKDPFIFHAINAWLENDDEPYLNQIIPTINNPQLASQLVEACVATHFERYYSTYYIKAEGEVDVAYIHDKKFWPIEIKWTNQLRSKDLKQIQKYKNGIVWAKTRSESKLENILLKPLPLELLRIGLE